MVQTEMFAAPGTKRTDFSTAAPEPTQNDMILAALRRGEHLSPLDALRRFGCLRLAARVDDLKRAGHRIQTAMVVNGGKRFATYYIEEA